MTFHYQRLPDSTWGDNRVTLPFAPQFLPYFTAETPPTASIELGGPRTLTTTLEETLPPGWSAVLPEAEHEDTPYAKSSTTYRLAGNTVFAERQLTVLQVKLPASEAKSYREWYDRASVGDVPYLQLVPPERKKPALAKTAAGQFFAPSASHGGKEVPEIKVPEVSTADVAGLRTPAELVAQARPLIAAADRDGARRLLDAAKAMNPKEQGLWMAYAALDAQAGQGAAAAGDLKLELMYHPGAQRVYNALAMQQAANGDSEAAVATLRDAVHEFPLSRDAALYLVDMLERFQRYPEALAAAEAALARLVDSGEDLTPLQTAVARIKRETQ